MPGRSRRVLFALALAVLIALTGADVAAYLRTPAPARAARALPVARVTLRDIAYGGTIEGLGDSLWAGYYATAQAETFRALIERHYGAHDLTPSGTGYGVSAATISAAFAAGTISVQPASLVIVELGTNDFGQDHTLSQFESDYNNVVWWVRREVGASPMLCLGIWNDGQADAKNGLGLTGAQYDAQIKSLCANQNAAYLSLEPYAYDVNAAGTQTFLGTSDGFHPSTVGHARIAGGILCLLAGNCTG